MGKTTRLSEYKWTLLIGAAFLGSVLWAVAFGDGLTDLIALLFSVCFLASLVASVAIGVSRRSKDSVYRIILNAMICLLLFPTMNLGGSLRNRLFLRRLPKFQEVTNHLIKDELAKANGEDFSDIVSLPPQYSGLNVLDRVQIRSDKENITVRYAMRDSSALGHNGYLYRLNDDPAALSKDYPKMGYTRVAPHWFFFSE